MPAHLILNTRPEPQATRFTGVMLAAWADEVEVIGAPLMRAEFLPVTLPAEEYAALLLTSETGALAAARLREGGAALPGLALCVGDRTAEVAVSAGIDTISAGGDAGDLLRLILSRPEERLLYLHGEDRAADLQSMLAPLGRRVTSLCVYRQRELPLLPQARAALVSGRPVILPLFSPRSALLFVKAAEGLPSDHLQPVVISTNARNALPEALARKAVLAERPDGVSMLAAIRRCFPATDH